MSKKKSKRAQHRRRRLQQPSSTAAEKQSVSVDDTDFMRSPPPRRRHKWRPGQLWRRLWQRKKERRRLSGERFYGDSAAEDEEELSRGSTPRYILDKAGIFRWPPIKLMDDDGGQLLRKVCCNLFI
jgi:hypothetical protein